jgi:preprotein translocase subunit SecD
MKLTWKIWLFLVVFALALISIFGIPPTFLQKGVIISSVESNSSAFDAGLRQGQTIIAIDGKSINNLDDFSKSLEGKYLSGEKVKTSIITTQSEFIIYSEKSPEITVSEIPKTRIKTGLDLSGGSRALVRAQDVKLSSAETNDLAGVIENRLNVYGLTDVKVTPVSDLSGDNYIKIEIAGATPRDLGKLISEQGKFEAKIGNESVFLGGKDQGVASVARSGQQAGIESCQQQSQGSYFCNFRFSVYLSEAAAKRQADVTRTLEVNRTPQGNYLSKKLDFYLDDKFLEGKSLLISEDLKGRVTTQISIEGSGSGATQQDAYKTAEQEMKDLQTILITGSLPYKLEISKLDTISPTLGDDFTNSILIAGVVALFCVACVIFIKYRKFKSSLAILCIGTSEIIITLGIAAFLDINLDLPAIAGVLAAIGTGVNDQIVILDEARRNVTSSMRERIKNAFQIIMGAYLTLVVAMIPLYFAGAGLLKGFALTTVIGLTLGVLITRPAFSDIVKMIEE